MSCLTFNCIYVIHIKYQYSKILSSYYQLFLILINLLFELIIKISYYINKLYLPKYWAQNLFKPKNCKIIKVGEATDETNSGPIKERGTTPGKSWWSY